MSEGLHSPTSEATGSVHPVNSGRALSVRTCVGCRARSSPTDLLRVVLVDRAMVPDPRGILPGRGAWLHPACLEIAERRKALTRALRAPGAPTLSAVRSYVARMSMTVTAGDGTVAMDAPVASEIGAAEDEPPMSAQP